MLTLDYRIQPDLWSKSDFPLILSGWNLFALNKKKGGITIALFHLSYLEEASFRIEPTGIRNCLLLFDFFVLDGDFLL